MLPEEAQEQSWGAATVCSCGVTSWPVSVQRILPFSITSASECDATNSSMAATEAVWERGGSARGSECARPGYQDCGGGGGKLTERSPENNAIYLSIL